MNTVIEDIRSLLLTMNTKSDKRMPKFWPGDKVYFLHQFKGIQGTIREMMIKKSEFREGEDIICRIDFGDGGVKNLNEDLVHATKEELLKTI